MAITDTLSRLKNYFIGWHTANYEILHETTEEITDEGDEANKMPTSRAVYRYIRAAVINLQTQLDNLWANFNNEINNIRNEAWGLGSWADYWGGENKAWDGGCEFTNSGFSKETVWGYIYKLFKRTCNLNTRLNNIENSYVNINDLANASYKSYDKITFSVPKDKKGNRLEDGSISLYRSGGICYARINMKLREKSGTNYNDDTVCGHHIKIPLKTDDQKRAYQPLLPTFGSFSYDECKWVAISGGKIKKYNISTNKCEETSTDTDLKIVYRAKEDRVSDLVASFMYIPKWNKTPNGWIPNN